MDRWCNSSESSESSYAYDFAEIDCHSITSSECSFDEIPRDTVWKKTDVNYTMRIERLLPKHLRRVKYQPVSKQIEERRNAIFKKILSDPEKYKSRKGFRTLSELKKKKKNKQINKSVSKENSSKGTKNTKNAKDIKVPKRILPAMPENYWKLPEKQLMEKANEYYQRYTAEADIYQERYVFEFIKWYLSKIDKKI